MDCLNYFPFCLAHQYKRWQLFVIIAKKVLIQGILYILIFLTYLFLAKKPLFQLKNCYIEGMCFGFCLEVHHFLSGNCYQRKCRCSQLYIHLLLHFAELSDLLESSRHTCLNIDLLFPKSLSCNEDPDKLSKGTSQYY